MPISATGDKRRLRRDAGVTLVEALTALCVVALVAGAAMLAAPGPDAAVRRAADALAARLALAADESVLRNRPVALLATEEGYGFARLEEGGWLRLEASPLAFRAWPEGVEHRVENARPGEARIARFDAQGGATPARITLSGGGARYVVTLDGAGRAHVERAR